MISLTDCPQKLRRAKSLDETEFENIAAGATTESQARVGDETLLAGLFDVRARALSWQLSDGTPSYCR